MRFRILLVTLVLVFLQISSGCVGMNDWSYDLPNDYAIWHINSDNIICGKEDEDSTLSSVTDRYVLEFCYGEQYVGLKCINDYDKYSAEEDTDIFYYLVDTMNDRVSVPMTEAEYNTMYEELDIAEEMEWIPTKPTPEDAVYPDEKYN